MVFWSLAASLPKHIRSGVHEYFAELLEALDEDSDVVEINIFSLQIALRFLSKAMPSIAPQISITDSGNVYFHWFDGRDALVGITFRPDGRATWSASAGAPGDSVSRMAEAGERHSEKLAAFLQTIAPWIFNERGEHSARRRVAA
jgi:hypothetical protein